MAKGRFFTEIELQTIKSALSIIDSKMLQLENTTAPVSTGASFRGRGGRVSKKDVQRSNNIAMRRELRIAASNNK